MKNLKYTKGDWEARGNYVYKKNETYTIASAITHNDNVEESKANAKLIGMSPRLLKSLLYTKSLIDKLEIENPKIAHKLMGVDEMIEIENIIKELNSK